MDQIKNSFDEKTIQKILKGGLIAGTAAAALFILNAVGTLEMDNPMLVGFVAWFVPFATNLIKEYTKGK